MLLVITCWAHVEITVWMYPKCDWWIHWEKNDPEPILYPRCSHWFLGHLTPSVIRLSKAWMESMFFSRPMLVLNLRQVSQKPQNSFAYAEKC